MNKTPNDVCNERGPSEFLERTIIYVLRRKRYLLPEYIMAADCNEAFLEDKSHEEEIQYYEV